MIGRVNHACVVQWLCIAASGGLAVPAAFPADAPLASAAPERRAESAQPLFDSGIVSRQTPGHAVNVDVPVAGAARLFLVAREAGDGIACDFANWAEPRFLGPQLNIRLTDLAWERVAVQYGEVNYGKNAENGPLSIAGQPVEFGIGTHANSVLVYRVPKGAVRFRARAGLDTQGTAEGCGSTVRFLVFTDKLPQRFWPVPPPPTPEPESVPLSRVAPAAELKLPPGFQAEIVYAVPADQGSWVCLTTDDRGRLITSDQFGQLYRVTLPRKAQPVRVEPLPVELRGAQGLLHAWDRLYVVVNDKGRSGLYQARDTNGDDQYDQVRLLRRIHGHGEHGPHAVVLGPDRRRLYVLGGNATELPEPEQSLVPRHWQLDDLLPHLGQTDGYWRPHVPGGWICRTDPAGRQFEVFAIGFRNPYDLAFNADGELFTFDADMEWDMGVPWYRPTRVNHVVSGAEFGWRTGSGKWPDYYVDSLPAVLDVGASSPTGLTFGYGARFPAKYQRALFMGDWSFGKIYVLHPQPQGATYTGTLETFCSGTPLPITDLVIRPEDGALYFIIGGRNTASALYRIAYRGPESTAPVEATDQAGASARQMRHELERLHRGPVAGGVAQAWPYLNHADRFLRYAARVALEHQPVTNWQARALHESNPRRLIVALIALARVGKGDLQPKILEALDRIDWKPLNESDRLDMLRAYSLALIRLGQPAPAVRRKVLAQLDGLFPAGSTRLNRELSQLLVYLRAPGVIERCLQQMAAAPSQEEQIWYLLILRHLERDQWTVNQLSRVFAWFQAAAAKRGGVTFNNYLKLIRSQMENKLTAADRTALAGVLQAPEAADPYAALQGRKLVRHWAVADLLPEMQANRAQRDLARGRRMFAAVMCIQCHRFNGEGGMTGPDLTGVGRRFDDRSLLESIIEPSRVISDQYNTVNVITKDDEDHVGRIGDINREVLFLMTDLINPAAIEEIPHAEIDRIVPASISMMPEGLLDYFSRAEILDLIAYLKAGGQ